MSKQETIRKLDMLIKFFEDFNEILDNLEDRIKGKHR